MQRLQIDPRQWADLNRLLDAALDLPAPERGQWLATLAEEYASLKPQLRELLAHAARVETHDFLNTLPKLETAPAAASSEQPGACIGPYRLVRELGAGGMGSVWLAERTDGLVKRPIALKLPHVASRRASLAERMAREREILAALTHPNIARLYDAGVTAEGRPYLALEYVEGKPVDVYCDEHGLDLRARLALFLQIGNAVAHAHAKLIIHRDLKPANILVASDGQVRLLDFGVAKLLDEGQAKATQLTELSGRALTPDYASPEQILGLPLTIATDVYSLGVVLYELLTGARPYKLKRDSRGALEDAIVQADAPRPSDVAARRDGKLLRGDLDTIVLTALKKAPQERYPTVNALVDDVVRYFDHRPVLARPDSAWYRLRKFTARHRLGVAAAASVLAAVVVGAGAAVWQARLATLEKQRAEQVKSFVLSVFREANPYRSSGKVLSSVDLLRIAKDRIDQVDRKRVDVRVEILNTLADSLLMLDDVTTAESVLKQALAESEGALANDHKLVMEAKSMLSQVYRRQSRPAQMRAVLEDLLPSLRKREARYPRHLVAGLLNLGNLACEERKLGECEAAVREALDVIARRLNDREVNKVMLLTLQSHVHQERGALSQALASADAAVRAARDFHGSNDEHAIVLNALHQRAVVLVRQDAVGGVQAIDAVLQATRKILGEDNRTLGLRYIETSQALLDARLYAEARTHAQHAVRILAAHQLPDSQILANARLALGRALLHDKCYDRAALELAHALNVSERTFGADHETVAIIREELARASSPVARPELDRSECA